MKYWTKEWYALCQQTGLHFGLSVHTGAGVKDENLYVSLYQQKEEEFIEHHRELYNTDPRILLEHVKAVPLHKLVNGDEILEEDLVEYRLSDEERSRIERIIADFDVRPPFDEEGCKQAFREQLDYKIRSADDQLPPKLLALIADIRVYALGFCTEDVLQHVIQLCKENEKKINQATEAALKELQAHRIPEVISSKLNFHDCTVVGIEAEQDLIITVDTSGGFTDNNRIRFLKPQIILQEEGIIGKPWLYNELYRTNDGYELHVLFGNGQLAELILRCNDIIIDKYTVQ